MISLQRHGMSVHREEDGAARLTIWQKAEQFKTKFDGTSQWSIQAWISFLAKGGRRKKRFQCCLKTNYSEHFLYSLSLVIIGCGT